MVTAVTEAILANSNISDGRKRFLATSITAISKKSLYMLLQLVFLVNLNNIKSGTMTANAGDSVQFLLVSRAILSGFYCSNVDVRSSRYDAVIDYRSKIFRVQIKETSGNTVSFKDRDRGGQGINTHHVRNIGQRITSQDCDINVAVDKQVGMCYIIPMRRIDLWDDERIKSMNVSELEVSELYDFFENGNNE
ncbi:hypothetical protein [uncultured Robinsoniella sp.]|uniref:hypothetical protein n=1 Tax=uncultured Robinsoniella sp. TaxID=904190 RepID=UPI00374ECF55